jgi:hypothetical protein
MPLALSFAGRTLAIEAPPSMAGEIAAFFALTDRIEAGGHPAATVAIEEVAAGRFSFRSAGVAPKGPLSRGEAIAEIVDALIGQEPAPSLPPLCLLRAAAVGWNDKTILIVGRQSAGKSALAAWLIDNGFAYLADDCVAFAPEDGRLTGFPGPLAFDAAHLSHVASLPGFRATPSVRAGERMLICPDRTWMAAAQAGECGLIVDVCFEMGSPLRLEPLPSDDIAIGLSKAVRGSVAVDDAAQAALDRFAKAVPAVKLTYGHYEQLEGVVDFLVRTIIEGGTAPDELEKFLSGLPRGGMQPKAYPIPARTERALHRKLTIGMATYDDFDGAYFSIQAIRMYHPEVLEEVEFVVIDNHPDGPASASLKALENPIPNYRYVPMNENVGTALSRERIFEEAAGDYVLCIDSHVFVAAGAIRKLLDYYAANPGTKDLLHGPILNDSLGFVSTHYGLNWRHGFYGTWETGEAGANPDAPPFEIAATGLGLFSCRRAVWPGFHSKFRGFGGEEGYIHEKFRRAGGRVLCLPFLRWLHRYQRPLGAPYPNLWEVSCCRFRRHRVRCFCGTGGGSWNDGSLRGSSSLKRSS